jgi:hypothetical protein
MNIHRILTQVVLLSVLVAASVGDVPALALSAPECSLRLCYRPPQYYLQNYKRLRFFPRDIFISGVNLNHPVDCVSSPGPILFALRGNSMGAEAPPLVQFNQHYVAAQLTHALVPLFTVISASKSSLSCFGLTFDPVKLNSGNVITPDTPLGALFTQCDVTGIEAISEARDADLLALARILARLNNSCQ